MAESCKICCYYFFFCLTQRYSIFPPLFSQVNKHFGDGEYLPCLISERGPLSGVGYDLSDKRYRWEGKWSPLPQVTLWQRICLPMQEMQACWFNPWVGNIHWRRKWQPNPVSLPGRAHGHNRLLGYSPWSHKGSDTTKHNHLWPLAAAATKSLQPCPTVYDPIDSSPPGSPVPGILQARTLEWVAISFSNAAKWKVKVKLLSRVQLFVTPWTAAHQAPSSMGFFQARVLEWGAIAFSVWPLTAFYFKTKKERPKQKH